jgi:2-polyprenyl-3-methyl-5-hydroxy-6-metoxy-1,4-benzoquinol methylase
MLKNDEIFWKPDEGRNAALLSWGGSEGDFPVLWAHSQRRWSYILQCLAQTGIPAPSGRVVEFGSGMGLLDDLLDDTTSSIVMLDHTDAYIEQRSRPLPPRCRHVLWSPQGLDALQREPASYDWLISVAVFYHVDDATAAALVRELGKLLKPGGYVLIEGWNSATPDSMREIADRKRLFARYPNYLLNVDLLRETLAPEYRALCSEGILLLQKQPGSVRGDGISRRSPG